MTMTHFQKKKLIHGILLIALTSAVSIMFNVSGISDIYERKTVDIRTKLCRSYDVLPEDIVIILIDESSLQALNEIAGRWPWPRYIHAELIDYLTMCGAESIVMDIMFSQNQVTDESNPDLLDPNDIRLAEATKNAGNVFHAFEIVNDHPDEINVDLLDKPMPEFMTERFSLKVTTTGQYMSHNNFYLPFKELYEASSSLGVVSFSADRDYVNRSEKLLFNYHDNFFPSHALAPALHKIGYDELVISSNTARILKAGITKRTIPLTPSGEYYVNMYGIYNTFSYSGVIESLMKVQQGITEDLMVRPEEFSGKIVYIGASAAATYDLKNTSMGNDVPGVFLHASICGNILQNDYLKFYGLLTNTIPLLIVLVLTVFSVIFMKKMIFQIYLPIVIAFLYLTISILLFKANIVIDIATPLSAMAFAYFASYTYISFTEGKEKRKVRNILGQYVAPAMLTTVLENSKEEYLKAEIGTKENLTIFFSDIRGFTTISEKYSVEQVVEVLNSYLSLMVNIIFDHKGTLDKFIGDAIVAFWGAPVKFEDHHYQAVISAIKMIKALEHYNLENKNKDLPELKIGIGIHTGDVILGNIGSQKKLDYTVIGDSVNLTSRLEGLTKNYFSSILISQTTYEKVKDQICCRIADYVKVKGKDEPIIIYDVIGENETISAQEERIAELTEAGFKKYRDQQFNDAISLYEEILSIKPDDSLIGMFIDRCKEYMENSPGANWDGCYVHTTK